MNFVRAPLSFGSVREKNEADRSAASGRALAAAAASAGAEAAASSGRESAPRSSSEAGGVAAFVETGDGEQFA